jgi:hypothetical protein
MKELQQKVNNLQNRLFNEYGISSTNCMSKEVGKIWTNRVKLKASIVRKFNLTEVKSETYVDMFTHKKYHTYTYILN